MASTEPNSGATVNTDYDSVGQVAIPSYANDSHQKWTRMVQSWCVVWLIKCLSNGATGTPNEARAEYLWRWWVSVICICLLWHVALDQKSNASASKCLGGNCSYKSNSLTGGFAAFALHYLYLFYIIREISLPHPIIYGWRPNNRAAFSELRSHRSNTWGPTPTKCLNLNIDAIRPALGGPQTGLEEAPHTCA